MIGVDVWNVAKEISRLEINIIGGIEYVALNEVTNILRKYTGEVTGQITKDDLARAYWQGRNDELHAVAEQVRYEKMMEGKRSEGIHFREDHGNN